MTAATGDGPAMTPVPLISALVSYVTAGWQSIALQEWLVSRTIQFEPYGCLISRQLRPKIQLYILHLYCNRSVHVSCVIVVSRKLLMSCEQEITCLAHHTTRDTDSPMPSTIPSVLVLCAFVSHSVYLCNGGC